MKRGAIRRAGRLFAATLLGAGLLSALPATVAHASDFGSMYAPWVGLTFHGVARPNGDGTVSRLARITHIRADIAIPCLPDTATDGAYYAWIGIGGLHSGHTLRVGVSAMMTHVNGAPVRTYRVWGESRSHIQNPFAPSYWRYLTPAPTTVPPWPTDLCGRSVPAELSANGRASVDRVNVSGPGTADLRDAEYVVQATNSMGGMANGTRFRDAFIDAAVPGGIDTFDIGGQRPYADPPLTYGFMNRAPQACPIGRWPGRFVNTATQVRLAWAAIGQAIMSQIATDGPHCRASLYPHWAAKLSRLRSH